MSEPDDPPAVAPSPEGVALASLGCKLNQAETESLARRFLERGYRQARPGQAAQICVINTCTVTQTADAKSRQALRQARRQHPRAFIVAVGCYAQRTTSEAYSCGADLVLGNEEKEELVERVAGYCPAPPGARAGRPSLRTRALVKIQEGCPYSCTYCIVPQVRGRGRSRPADQVVQEVQARSAEGYREVVLTGTEIGAYGRDRPGEGGLEALVRRLLAETEVPRLRLSSLQPQEITPSFLELWRDGRLCPHLHLPLQSGSDRVLRAMGRHYDAQGYREAVARARALIPGLALTTDVIVGFPGEGEPEFAQSYGFCREMGFARIHVFPFSPRQGTPAAAHQREGGARAERLGAMQSLARESQERFIGRFLGRTLGVLWEREVAPGVWSGHTGNYLPVLAPSLIPLAGQVAPARLLRWRDGGLWGEVVDGMGLLPKGRTSLRDEGDSSTFIPA